MYGGFFEVEKKNQKINELSEELNDPNIWNNPSNAEKITKELSDLKKLVAPVIKIKENVEVLKQFNEFSSLEMDEELKLQFESLFKETSELLKKEEFLTYLSGKYDNNPAIFEIHAGAGGTESCDWVAMLARMYTKYFDKKGYSYEMIDKQDGEEAGFKSVVYIVKGSYAYGYLKNEKGVHRLVRLSPFDSNNRRHTSFAAVDVIPEFDNNIDINLNEKDLRIDVYRSTGAGGQGVNTTDSAVRITHLPTGTVVTCQNERSQLKNKETALKVLKSKLYQIELKKRQDAVNNIKKEHNEIEFGSQIRSYVLHPYSMIKDHRTGYETSNVNKVLDGDLDGFIESNLKGEKQDETI